MLRIKIIDVGTTSAFQAANGLEYKTLEVIYKDSEEQVLSKKLVSFKNKNVFKAASNWTRGTVVDITNEVDSKGYFQWVAYTVIEDEVPNDVPL